MIYEKIKLSEFQQQHLLLEENGVTFNIIKERTYEPKNLHLPKLIFSTKGLEKKMLSMYENSGNIFLFPGSMLQNKLSTTQMIKETLLVITDGEL